MWFCIFLHLQSIPSPVIWRGDALQIAQSADEARTDSEDSSWQPPDHTPSDVSLTDSGTDTPDTDYDVYVPKTAAQMLQEYQSCESDDSWQEEY